MLASRMKAVVAAAASVLVAVVTVIWVGVMPSFAQERHVIKIAVHPEAATDWSAEATLYDGQGVAVYSWRESHGAGEDFVRWEFTDGGDGGWIDLTIHPSEGQSFKYEKECEEVTDESPCEPPLTLTENHCFVITAPILGFFSTVEKEATCPF